MIITEQDIKELGLTKCNSTYIEIYVNADVNDGDYINETNTIDSLDEYKKLQEIAVKILNKGSHNWDDKSYLTNEELDLISDFLPYMDNEEIHTIDAISFRFVINGVEYV